MRAALSKRQRQVYEYLRKSDKSGRGTLAEIAAHLGISRSTAYEHLQTLVRKGWVQRTPHIANAYRSLPPYECCPHCGKELQP